MSRAGTLSILLCAAALPSCAKDPDLPRLTVELAGQPVAEPFIVHGNCVAAWFLNVPLRIRADQGGTVALDSLDVRVDQGATGALLGQDRIDLSHQQLGPDLMVEVPARVRVADDGVFGYQFPVVLSGALDASLPDFGAHVPYRLQTTAQVLIPPPTDSGACSPAP